VKPYTIVTLLFGAFNIWLASKRATFSVCAVCMAARKEPILFF